MKKNFFVLGMLALVLGFGAIVGGCAKLENPYDPNAKGDAPTFKSAIVEGDRLVITLSKKVTDTPYDYADHSDFKVTVIDTSDVEIPTDVTDAKVDGTTITLTLSPPITDRDATVTVLYERTTGSENYIKNTGDNPLESFTDKPVTNKTAISATIANPATYTVVADGVAGVTPSAKLTFTFSADVSAILAPSSDAEITIGSGTGAAAKVLNSLAKVSGTVWTLVLSEVYTEGNITVTISGHAEIETGTKTVAVYKNSGVTYDVVQIGGTAGAVSSTGIQFIFNEAVTGLTAADIAIIADTGTATKGALSGSGKTWTLALTSVSKEGNVKLTISKGGIDSSAKSVPVHSNTGITYTAVQITEGSSSSIRFTFSNPVNLTTVTVAPDLTGDIVFKGDTGTVTLPSIPSLVSSGTPADTVWTVALDGASNGNVKVSVNAPGVDAAEKTIPITGAAATIDYTLGAVTNNPAGTTISIPIIFDSALPTDISSVLDETYVTIDSDTGAAVKGTFTATSGTLWTLTLTDIFNPGNVYISIHMPGIVATPKPKTVDKADDPIAWSVVAAKNAAGDAATVADLTTHLKFTFSFEPTGLATGDIAIVSGAAPAGTATAGIVPTITTGLTEVIVPVTGVTEGNIKVKINRAGITATEQPIAVTNPAGPITWSVVAAKNAAGDAATSADLTTHLKFTFSFEPTGLATGDIAIVPGAAPAGTATAGIVPTITTGLTEVIVPVTGVTEGNIKVKINRAGITATEQPIAVTNPAAPITWTAEQIGGSASAETTAIKVTFGSVPSSPLTAGSILITDDGGAAATNGAPVLSGTPNGMIYTFPVRVVTGGPVNVAINGTGIDPASQSLTVYANPIITYTAVQDGGEPGVKDSTGITLTFSSAVTDTQLTGKITIGNTLGVATWDMTLISGSGGSSDTVWTLNFDTTVGTSTVWAAGNLTVRINQSPIETGVKTVPVYKGIDDIMWTVDEYTGNTTNSGSSGFDSSGINFTFTLPVGVIALPMLTEADITISSGNGTDGSIPAPTDGYGAAAKGTLGATWPFVGGVNQNLTLTPYAEGYIIVTINKEGIDPTPHYVKIYSD